MASGYYYRPDCGGGGLQATPFSITLDATDGAIAGYNQSQLVAAIVATGNSYPNGAPVTAAAQIHQLDFGLKPIDGHYTADGSTKVVASTADAALEYPAGGGEWRDLDPGGQQEFQLPCGQALSDWQINVAEGSIVIISGSVYETPSCP